MKKRKDPMISQAPAEAGAYRGINARRRARYALVFALLVAALFAITVLNINIGNVPIPIRKIIQIIFTKTGTTTEVNIIWKIRLPRILMAALLGGALSLSGFLLQTFFENPIAGPFVLGISSSAKMVVAFAMIYFMELFGSVSSYALIGAAFVGSLLSVGFILLFSRRIRGMSTLLVAGIMIGYICTAITDFVVTFAADSDIINLHNWSMGSFSGMNWSNVGVAAIVVGADRALEHPLRHGDGLCRAHLLCGHCGAVPHQAVPEYLQAPGGDPRHVPGRRRILYALRSDRPHGLCPYGAEYQHSHLHLRRAGGDLYDAAPERQAGITWRKPILRPAA